MNKVFPQNRKFSRPSRNHLQPVNPWQRAAASYAEDR